jgi:hypothetical protein
MPTGVGINNRLTALAALLLAACSAQQPAQAPAAHTSETETPATTATVWPSGLVVLGDGYPNAGDACRRIGESARTVDMLDDSAQLVGCPGGAAEVATLAIVALGGQVVGSVANITMITVPQGDANAGMAPATNNANKIKG